MSASAIAVPGLAQLRLSQGRGDDAAASMRRVVASMRGELDRARYLPAHVEIMLAVGQLEEASAAASELEAIAARFDTEVLRASAAQARGSVLLAEQSAQAACEPLRAALQIWQRMGAPYLAARVQVLGGVDELLASHKILVGPRRETADVAGTAGVAAVVKHSHVGKQTTLLVRTDGPIHDPAWTVEHVSLEDLVLAYLANSDAGALPGPARLDVGVST